MFQFNHLSSVEFSYVLYIFLAKSKEPIHRDFGKAEKVFAGCRYLFKRPVQRETCL